VNIAQLTGTIHKLYKVGVETLDTKKGGIRSINHAMKADAAYLL